MSTTTTSLIQRIGSPPRDPFMQKDTNNKDTNHNNWTKWTNNVQGVVDTANYYGFPSLCLNSDFNFESGVPASITQADGDAALWSQLWQIQGASVATYTISHPNYTSSDYNPTGSLYYVNFAISNYTGDGTGSDLYGYQTQTGLNYLMQYQSRIISMSILVNNTQTKSINAKFEVYFNFNTMSPNQLDKIYASNVFEIPIGISEISSQITTDDLSQYTVGASPYVQFRLVFCNLIDNTAAIKLSYLKAELTDLASVLYIDHGTELTRINNF